MKKLVYLFAIVLGISFASCDRFNHNASDSQTAAEAQEQVKAPAEGENVQEGNTAKQDAPAAEVQTEEAK